jgi:hypothetical protein
MTNEWRNPNDKTNRPVFFRHLNIRASFFLRPWCFVIVSFRSSSTFFALSMFMMTFCKSLHRSLPIINPHAINSVAGSRSPLTLRHIPQSSIGGAAAPMIPMTAPVFSSALHYLHRIRELKTDNQFDREGRARTRKFLKKKRAKASVPEQTVANCSNESKTQPKKL